MSKFKSTIVTIDIRKCIDCLNPRDKASYDADQMADDIALHDFRLLNKPIVLAVAGLDKWAEAYKVKGMSNRQFQESYLELQGHRRIAGLLVIFNNPERFGLTPEQAEKLMFQDVEVLTGLTEEEARAVAFDERYHKGLNMYEVVLEMIRLFHVGFDLPDVTLRCGKIICEARMVSKGMKIWNEYVNTRDGAAKRKLLVQGLQNAVKHVKYAVVLGPKIEEVVVQYFKYDRDGLDRPEDEVIPFRGQWSAINALHSAKINSTSQWEGPITGWTYDKNGLIENVEGGCKEVTAELRKIVKEFVDGTPTKTGLTSRQKKDIAESLTDPTLRNLATAVFINGEQMEGLRDLDREAKRRTVIFNKLHEIFEKLPKDRQPLVKALLGEQDPDKVIEVFMTPTK